VSDPTPSHTASPRYRDFRHHVAEIKRAALAAAEPASCVRKNLRLEGDVLHAGPHRHELRPGARIFLVAFGKAAQAMSRAAVDVLGERTTAGIAAVPHTCSGRLPKRIQAYPAGHPLPDSGSLAAGQAIADLLSNTKDQDIVITLISGGGSAMLELPVHGVTLDDLRSVNLALLHSGAPIDAINTVRRTLSQIKGGGLARMAAPSPVIALILSDVVGNRLSSIASGPTVLRSVNRQAARAVLESHGIWDQTPYAVRAALGRPESPPKRARRPKNILIGSNRQVVEAAARKAAKLGFTPRVLSFQMHGEAREVGHRLARGMRRTKGPTCILMGGETTVYVRGSGRGGRNQELALAAAKGLEGVAKVVVMALATDGIDGPTDAAGAVITGKTVPKARALGFDPESALAENDCYPLLDAAGALLHTGPTGTNLNDLVLGLVYP
jgi:glycerate 2-kinase